MEYNNINKEEYEINKIDKERYNLLFDDKKYKNIKSNVYDNEKEIDILKEDLKENIGYYEVLTDLESYWVSLDTLVEICHEINHDLLIQFNFKMDTDVIFGEEYVYIEERFMNFIKENTFNPKYFPKFALLRTMHSREIDYDDINQDERISVARAIRIDGTTEDYYEKSR